MEDLRLLMQQLALNSFAVWFSHIATGIYGWRTKNNFESNSHCLKLKQDTFILSHFKFMLLFMTHTCSGLWAGLHERGFGLQQLNVMPW